MHSFLTHVTRYPHEVSSRRKARFIGPRSSFAGRRIGNEAPTQPRTIARISIYYRANPWGWNGAAVGHSVIAG
ncbi:hypothetical protein Y88_2619 [Novosphingobium nitrogenifigens DSM 19370]|uniref:Uncharacterized protein n=1 Tax=Novosphingobium nitrogenifigens DSM 19370 TaxID=983920 RepID=F1Z768_9SPHN|nr:hypothetical protein Y88_2619 [Novosphingobium nitrogenifigens DSM 19370]